MKNYIPISQREVPIPAELLQDIELNKGGPGSGHYGHSGRPGSEGGSSAGHGALIAAGFKHTETTTNNGTAHIYKEPNGSVAILRTVKGGKPTIEINLGGPGFGSKIGPTEDITGALDLWESRMGASFVSYRAPVAKGGAGSGNFGHAGRPGEIGGSGPGGEVLPTPGRAWIDHAPGLPKDTLAAHTQSDGSLSPERQKLHQQIITSAFDRTTPVPEDQQPVAILMMGGTASGKSSIVDALDKRNMVVVDADEIKTKLPEYQQAVNANARDAAFMVHEESSMLGKQIRDQAISTRRNVLVDGTGGSSTGVQKYGETIDRLKAAGYEVRVIMSDLDYGTALNRMLARAERTGRYVPPSVMKGIYDTAPKNFIPITQKADSWALYDNRVARGLPPRLVWSKMGGKETAHDNDFVSAWKRKYQ